MARVVKSADGCVAVSLVLCLTAYLACGTQREFRPADVQTRTSALYQTPVNVASQANGGVATASSTYNSSYPATAVNDGDRKGVNWGNGGGWNDATWESYPDWVQVTFDGEKTINEIDVFTLQDNYGSPADPTSAMAFSQYGITSFDAQYWNGTAWVTVPGGSITGNSLVWRKITFPSVVTQKIQVSINGALSGFSRIVEIEAYTQPPMSWADTVPAAIHYQDLGVSLNWENAVVAIPPNTASCGQDGAIIASGNGTAPIAITTLTCAKTGTSCSTIYKNPVDPFPGIHLVPEGMVDRFWSSDSDIARVNISGQKTILIARMLRRNPCADPDNCSTDPTDPYAYRGMVAFWASSDCGGSWTELGQLDPHTWGLRDFDMGRLYADPWSDRVFYVVQDGSGVTAAFVSNDGGQHWAAPQSLIWGGGAYRVTTLESGQAYFFGTSGSVGNLYKYDSSNGWSSPMTLPIDPIWDAPTRLSGNRGLVRIGELPDGDYLRALYPTQHGTSTQQDIAVAVIKVVGTPPVATVVSQKVFSASDVNGQGSIMGATFVETDRSELPTAATENTALLYWNETNGPPSSSTTQEMKGALVRDLSSWSATLTLTNSSFPAFASPYGWAQYYNDTNGLGHGQGDYRTGAFFYETGTQTLNFLPSWVEWGAGHPDGIFTNIVRFPQSDIPEEQFGPYESLGTPNGGGAFVQAPAIAAQGLRLDVYAVASDLTIQQKSFSSGTWSAWETVPGGTSSFGIAAVASTASQRDLVAVRSDGSMYYARDLSGWSSWINLGPPPDLVFDSAPGISAWSGGRLDVFGRASDAQLWHAECDSGCTSLVNWSGWEALWGTLDSGPAAVSWGPGRNDIVALGTDLRLYHKSYDWSYNWSGWEPLGGEFLPDKQLAVSTWGPGRTDIFARGLVDNLVYHKSYDWSYGWSTWLTTNSLPSTGGIAAASGGVGQIDLVTIEPDGAVWHAANAR